MLSASRSRGLCSHPSWKGHFGSNMGIIQLWTSRLGEKKDFPRTSMSHYQHLTSQSQETVTETLEASVRWVSLTHTHRHTYTHTHTQSHTYTRSYTHLHIHILTYTHTHTHTPPSVIFPGHIASAAAMSPRHGHRLLKVIGLDSNDRKLCPCTWCGARGFRTHRGPGE